MNHAREHIGVPDVDFYFTDERDWRREAAWFLCAQMGAHSEDTYCASWMFDVEYDFWSIGIGELSPGLFDAQLCRDLVALARLVDCWWYCPRVFDGRPDTGPQAKHIGQRCPVDLRTWELMLSCRAAMRKAERWGYARGARGAA